METPRQLHIRTVGLHPDPYGPLGAVFVDWWTNRWMGNRVFIGDVRLASMANFP